jgi:hypothetical protein
MDERRPILAYLDGAESDVAVTAFAAALATELGCRLILARTVRPRLQPLFVPADELPHWCAQDALDRTAEAVRCAEAELAALEQSVGCGDISRMLLVSSRPCSRLLTWLETNPVAFLIGACYRRSAGSRFTGPTVLDRVAQSGLALVMTLGFQAVALRTPAGRGGLEPKLRRARCRRPRRLTRP